MIAAQADAQVSARIEYLAERSSEGLLTDEERVEYETLVSGLDFVAALQARARKVLGGTHDG